MKGYKLTCSAKGGRDARLFDPDGNEIDLSAVTEIAVRITPTGATKITLTAIGEIEVEGRLAVEHPEDTEEEPAP